MRSTFKSYGQSASLLEAALKVRDDYGHNNDIRGLFHRIGDRIADQMSFEWK